jgi:peptidoglycan/LPS O-acetylase OafA/YrhL
MDYRREIDGLRAVAVVPVVFFHAGFDAFSGGFVGVDVFFVISGYLITSILVEELDHDRFSIVGFYERRARRILPALVFVMLCCLPFAWWWMPPDTFLQFGHSLGAVSLFVSNVLFWQEIGYFAAAAEQKPLLHTWSLAVEEQYYLIYPLLLAVIWRWKRNWLVGLLLVGAFGSLVLAEMGARYRPDAAFYLIPFRAWELLVGSLIAIRHSRVVLEQRGSEWGASIGVVALVLAIVVYNPQTPFPGLYALLPVFGTALVIHCATPATTVGRMLGLPFFVGIGLISYSVYLWHQPLYAFARIRSLGAPGDALLVSLAALSILLGWFSWRYVEKPFRGRTGFSRRAIFSMSGFAIIGAVGLSLLIHLNRGVPTRFEFDADITMSLAERTAYVVTRQEEAQLVRAFYPDGPVKVLVIGDSFSQDFINVLSESVPAAELQLASYFVPNVCQIYLADPESDLGLQRDPVACASERRQEWPLVASADVVYLASMWEAWSAAALPATIAALEARGAKHVEVVGTKGFGELNRSALFHIAAADRSTTMGELSTELIVVNKMLLAAVGPSRFVDVHEALAGRADSLKSPLFDSSGYLLSHDGAHLTAAGVRLLVERIGPLLRKRLDSLSKETKGTP